MRIVFVDLSMRGFRHVPFNAMLWRIAAHAYPDAAIDIWADQTHLDELGGFSADLKSLAAMRALTLSRSRAGKDEQLSARRLADHLRILARVVRSYPGERLLMVVSSICATGIAAAQIVTRLCGPRRLRTLCVLHGNVATIRGGWRPRNPLTRALDLASTLRRRPAPGFRYLVLEAHIREGIEDQIPALRGRVDVLPHPVNEQEALAEPARAPASPPRAGFVGLATLPKGFDVFLRLAAELALRERPIEMRLVGHLHSDFDALPPRARDALRLTGSNELPRCEFVERVRSLDYVCVPYGGSYYGLAASGSLMDAITFCRPLVAMRSPMLDALFASAGDLGYLCADEAEMAHALDAIATQPDPARFAAQVEALVRLRATRMPVALAAAFRAAVERLGDGGSGPAQHSV